MTTAVLPVHLTRFIGRDRELDDLARLVARSRLVTLTGAGGSGKTRLAREAAERAASAFSRVAWVDLAPLADPGLIVQQVGDALGVPQRPGMAALDLLIAFLRERHMLVVLDNCEHLVEACAELAEALLRGCPRLALIATSREALGVASETAWLVPPLATAEAEQLFVERAQAVLPVFARDASNEAAVREICRRLDGLPLAIELAAARVRVLTPAQIAERLDQAFRLLTTGSRTALPRHRTLRATMEWSFALLGPREQVLLPRLAVFAGSFTLDAAEAVCAGDSLEAEDILDGVATLVDKSLVVMEADDGAARYRLLETVRQYALEHFAGAAEREGVEQRFAGHYLGVLEAAAPNLVGGSNDPRLLARLVSDHDNLRAAAVWAIADRGGAELALRFVGALFWFLYAMGLFREARELTDRALALATGTEAPLARGRALVTSALTALAQGEYVRSRADFEAALPLLREAGDTPGTAAALAMYGAAWLLDGDITGAVPILDEALALTAEWPDHDIARIFARFYRGWAAYTQGQIDLADSLFAPCRRAGHDHRLPTTYAHTTAALAYVAFARGQSEEACRLLAEALECELANRDGWGIAQALDVAALVAARRGRYEEAALLVAGIEAHRARLAMALSGPAPAERTRLLEQLRQALGSRFDVVYARGAVLSTAAIVERGFAEASRDTAEHPVAQPTQPAPQADGAAPRLRVLALGPLQVFVGERLIAAAAWGSARPRELLLYLLLHPEGRTKEQVGLAFWPDASPAQLRNSFHVTLHRLRRALGGADWVTVVSDRYRIPPDLIEEFDARAFEQDVTAARVALKRQEADAVARLEQALARFRGDLLDGEPAGDWHLEHRDQLQRLYVDALMELGARHMKEERHERAADVFRRVLARDGVHEQALQELMRCHVAMGERPQALRLYRQFADRLRAELETEPRVDTVRLFERLQQGAGA
jgi:predicted ATPase/DNA-binding SARP family transcriptional activator